MLESAFLFVGTIAFIWTALTLGVAMVVSPTDSKGDAAVMVGGVVGFVLWGVWTYGTLNIEVVGDSTTFQFQHPELAILGVVMALIPGYLALEGPINLYERHRRGELDDL